MGFSKKKLGFYSKSLKVANLLQNAHQMVLFLKNVFNPDYEFFWQKNQEPLNFGKIRNYDEERVLFREKNVFFSSKAFLTKMGKRKICRW